MAGLQCLKKKLLLLSVPPSSKIYMTSLGPQQSLTIPLLFQVTKTQEDAPPRKVEHTQSAAQIVSRSLVFFMISRHGLHYDEWLINAMMN